MENEDNGNNKFWNFQFKKKMHQLGMVEEKIQNLYSHQSCGAKQSATKVYYKIRPQQTEMDFNAEKGKNAYTRTRICLCCRLRE